MNSEEYAKLSRVEAEHWFYRGKREIVRYWLNRAGPLKKTDLLLDCGAGTGKFVEEIGRQCQTLALDDHAESLVLAREKLGPDRVREGTCSALPFPDESIDFVTALDVLEHVRDDRQALSEISRVLKPGGITIITVPALMALWSDWDVVLHHHRRYTKSRFEQLLPGLGLKVVHCAYINVAALPAVWLVRKSRVLLGKLGRPIRARSEDVVPPESLNRILRWLFVKLACQETISFPAGIGLLAVLQRSGPGLKENIATHPGPAAREGLETKGLSS